VGLPLIEVKVPGKIMLAGEWSILEPGNVCIVLPVNKFITVQIKESPEIIFDTESRFCFYAVQNCLQFLTERGVKTKSFEITISSEISGSSQRAKPGLGSSAAVTVAVCKAILKFHGFDLASHCHPDCHPELDSGSTLFKLAFLSHYSASGKLGSGFDVAACTYQKPIVYRRFDSTWLSNQLAYTKKLSDLVLSKWPMLEIEEIKLPEGMHILIGFTGKSASTPMLIEKMQKFKQENLICYQGIIGQINSVVLDLIQAIYRCDQVKIINLLNQNRDLLIKLGIESGVDLETQELSQLINTAKSFGAASKITGAGGGDCAIAVCFDKDVAQKIKTAYKSDMLASMITEAGLYSSVALTTSLLSF
jgi:phosphomevalonate kinase